jgi:hypothetical protein
MENVRDGLQQIASGSISGAYNGLITLGKGAKEVDGKLGEAFGKVSETLEDVPVVGWIVSIIDLFKDGLSVVIGGLLDAVFNAVSGILDDVLSGDLFVTIGKSLLSGVGKIFDALTWGGFSSWTTSSNAKKITGKHIVKNTAHGIEHRVEQATDDHTQTILEKVYNTYNPADNRHILKCFGNLSESLAQFAVHFLGTFAECDQAIIRPADTAGGNLLQSVPHILHTGLQTGGSIREGLPGTVSRFLQGVYILTRGIGISLRRFQGLPGGLLLLFGSGLLRLNV